MNVARESRERQRLWYNPRILWTELSVWITVGYIIERRMSFEMATAWVEIAGVQ